MSEASKNDQCLLTWSDSSAKVHQNLYDLMKQNILCDVTLVDQRGRSVSAHACVLAAGSPVLKSTLMLDHSHNFLQKRGLSMKVADFTQQDWKIIMEYLYLGRISIGLNSALIKRVHRVARMLKITSLATMIWRKVGSLRLKVSMRPSGLRLRT